MDRITARKFGKQMFISLDLPPHFLTKEDIFLEVEKHLVGMLKELERKKH